MIIAEQSIYNTYRSKFRLITQSQEITNLQTPRLASNWVLYRRRTYYLPLLISAMSKRPPPESPIQSAKRHRPDIVPHITRLSDELLLRIASFLRVSDLISCQRVSKQFERVAHDSQIWKALFYDRFVRPRAWRIPGLARAPPSSLHYSSRNSKWLQDEGLARNSGTKWKDLYKLRHNWNRGSCSVSEINIAENPPPPPPLPPLMIRLHEVHHSISFLVMVALIGDMV
jgi:hypothetical protein